MRLQQIKASLALTLIPFFSSQANAADPLKEFDFHGFATQSYLYSSDNDFFGESDDGSLEFFELGINTFWNPTEKLKFAAQAVARDAGKTDDGSIRMDYAFIEYELASSDSGKSGVRMGRVVNPLGFFNESRDVAATRPGTLLPQSIYFDANRNVALSSDGVYFFHEMFNKQSDISFDLAIAKPRARDPDLEPAILGGVRPGTFEGTASWMARVIYDYDFGRIRLGLTVAEINLEYKPRNDPFIRDADFKFQPIYLSAQYQGEKWQFTSEVARRTSKIDGLGINFTGTSFYLQTSYRFTPSTSAFVRYDSLVWDDDDKERLLALRSRLRGDVSMMADAALKKTRTEANGDLSSMPIHMADIGSDNYEQEFTLSLMETEEDRLELIEGALERIEDGVYGSCLECGGPVPKTRLNAIPYTPFCVKCATKLEGS